MALPTCLRYAIHQFIPTPHRHSLIPSIPTAHNKPQMQRRSSHTSHHQQHIMRNRRAPSWYRKACVRIAARIPQHEIELRERLLRVADTSSSSSRFEWVHTMKRKKWMGRYVVGGADDLIGWSSAAVAQDAMIEAEEYLMVLCAQCCWNERRQWVFLFKGFWFFFLEEEREKGECMSWLRMGYYRKKEKLERIEEGRAREFQISEMKEKRETPRQWEHLRLERVEEEMVGKYGKEWRIYIIFTEWESDEPERCAKGWYMFSVWVKSWCCWGSQVIWSGCGTLTWK